MSTTTVFLAALATAIAAGLGAVPFFFIRRVGTEGLGLADAAAGGSLLAAITVLAGRDFSACRARPAAPTLSILWVGAASYAAVVVLQVALTG
jgi:hypothetical protein